MIMLVVGHSSSLRDGMRRGKRMWTWNPPHLRMPIRKKVKIKAHRQSRLTYRLIVILSGGTSTNRSQWLAFLRKLPS